MVFSHLGTGCKGSQNSIAAARGKSSQNHHFLLVSEVTLGIFGVQFWGFSVLQRYGVSLPAGDFFHGVFHRGKLRQPFGEQEEKVAKIHSSSKRKKQPKSSFSMGFRSYVRHFRGAILGFSVLQRHGVSLPGGDFFQVFPSAAAALCLPIWGQEEKVAKIHSSSKRKKQPKSSFSMGFRSYVRHFRGAILGLLRPSEAWCFPCRQVIFSMVFSHLGSGCKGSQNSQQQQEEKAAKIIIFYGFQKLRQAFSGCNFGASPSFRGMVFPWCFPAAAAAKASAVAGGKGSQNSQQQQEEKAAKSIIFYGFQKLRQAFSGCNFGASPSFRGMVFCTAFPCREVIFSMVFSHPGTSSSSSKSLCSSRRKRQPKFIAAARGKSSQNHHFLWVSEVTLGIFGVQFWGFSASFRGMVFPCRQVIFSIVFSHLGTGCKGSQNSQQQQEEKGAKSIIFYGFQKLRQAFSGCNFGASPSFRGMVFPCREVIFSMVFFTSEDQQQQQQKPLQQQEEKVAKIHSSSKRKKQPKSSFSMGFRSYVRHFRGTILGLLRPSEAWCFPAGR